MFEIKTNGTPKYIQLKEAMVAELKKGGFKENEKFYTEKELMHKYQLSYATVSHAVRSMTKDGYFIRRKGIGTFVNAEKLADMAEPVNSRTLFINDISRLTDKDLTPYSWYTFEQLQRGIIDTYEGPVSYLESSDMQSIMKDEEDLPISCGRTLEVVHRLVPHGEFRAGRVAATGPGVCLALDQHRRGMASQVELVLTSVGASGHAHSEIVRQHQAMSRQDSLGCALELRPGLGIVRVRHCASVQLTLLA